MYNQIMKMVLAPIYASFMPILESLAAGAGNTLLGGLLGGGGGSSSSVTTTPNPLAISGGGLFDTTARGQINLTPEMQAIQSGLFAQAGGQDPFQQQAGTLGAGFLGQVGEFDPFAAAQTQFGRMEDILAPQRDQERMAQESRLFSQGRLGSTGGAQQQQALESAFLQQQQQGLYDALGQGQAIQGQQIAQGMALGQVPLSQQTQSLNNLLGIQTGAVDQLEMGGTLGGNTVTSTTPGIDPLATLGTGMMTGGAEQLQQGIGGLFSSNNYMNQNSGAFNPAAYQTGGGEGGTWSNPIWGGSNV